jgi:hypothetical protein
MPVIDLKDTTIYVRDRETNWVEVRVGEGNLTYSEKRTVDLDKNRGRLSRTKEGEEEPVEVSFAFLWEYLKGKTADPPTLEECLKGEADGWVSAATNPSSGGLDEKAPFTVHIQVVREDGDCGETEQYAFAEFTYTEITHDMKNGTIDCRGICNRVQVYSQRFES